MGDQVELMNDMLHFAMHRACIIFGGGDQTFNLAGLSGALTTIAGITGALDGRSLRALLVGRPDVDVLSGGSHYRLL